MMNYWTCNRRSFADYIAKRKPVKGSKVQSTNTIKDVSLSGDEILLVWQNSPTETYLLPSAVIVAEGSTPNFLAWVLTYFRHIRPFTAHCRVLTPSFVDMYMQPTQSQLQPALGSASIGLILAEGIAYSVGRTDLNRLPFSAFARTLSFAFAEGAKQYQRKLVESGEIFDHIKTGWLSVRELSSQPMLDLSPSDVSDIWKLVLEALEGGDSKSVRATSEPLIVEALREIGLNGCLSGETWSHLSNRFQKVESLVETMKGPREARVRAAEIAIRELANGPAETRRHRSFVAGYIASQIQPGSLDHFRILFPAITDLRESLLWYGACSGLSPDTSVDGYGDGLGLLMKRELERPSHWLDSPCCDVALTEMEILFRNRNGTKLNLHTLERGILKVEIFPLISISVKWTGDLKDHDASKGMLSARQMKMFDEDELLRHDVLQLLKKIDESAMSLNAIRKQVEIKFGEKVAKSRKRKKK